MNEREKVFAALCRVENGTQVYTRYGMVRSMEEYDEAVALDYANNLPEVR